MNNDPIIIEAGSSDVTAPGENLNKLTILREHVYPNGSNYLFEGKLYYGQVDSEGKLILDPKIESLKKIGDFTFNLVPLEIKVGQDVKGKQEFYGGQHFPTASTCEAITRLVRNFCPSVFQINIRGNQVNPKLFGEQVLMDLIDRQENMCTLAPGEIALTWMDQGVDKALFNIQSCMKDGGLPV